MLCWTCSMKRRFPILWWGPFLRMPYGEARATKDADFVVHFEEEGRSALLAKLPNEFEFDQQASFETITGHTRQILRIPSRSSCSI